MFFDYDGLDSGLGYKLMTSTIVPRPIAWVSTRGAATGGLNAAPFSLFNIVGVNPAIIVLGLMAHPKRGYKDTARNILETGEFCVNLVPETLLERMNITSIDAPEEVSEFELADLTAADCVHIGAPRILESPVSFECRTYQTIQTGPHQAVVIGQVLALHIDDSAVMDAERGYIDTNSLGLVGRMHGAGWYTRTSDQVKLDRPSWPVKEG